uniref:Uncharacterized protein n=1 Tax=Nelumbo nucifera TaxID=4432 RepID=A0A822ZXA9_NELNU|nr:TPA_asm: hypothetical protein HUJ06_017423 [Nelumbo nucifera]
MNFVLQKKIEKRKTSMSKFSYYRQKALSKAGAEVEASSPRRKTGSFCILYPMRVRNLDSS